MDSLQTTLDKPVKLHLALVVVLPEPLDQLESQAKLVSQANREFPAPLEFQVAHHSPAWNQSSHHANHAQLDLRDPQATLDPQATRDHQAHQARTDSQARMALLDPLDHQDPLETLAPTDPLEIRARMASRNQLSLESLVRQVEMALLDPREPLDPTDPLVPLAAQDPREDLAHLVPMVLLDHQAKMALQDPMDHQERKVSVRNTAHWMEESSSRTEPSSKSSNRLPIVVSRSSDLYRNVYDYFVPKIYRQSTISRILNDVPVVFMLSVFGLSFTKISPFFPP